MNLIRKLLPFLLITGMVTVFLGGFIPHATAAAVEPIWKAGNPSCTDLGYVYGLKFNYPNDSTGGTYPIGTGTVTWSTDGTYVNWTSTFGIDAVIVKGGRTPISTNTPRSHLETTCWFLPPIPTTTNPMGSAMWNFALITRWQ